MTDDDWVKSAITDDSVVVDLLMRLHRAPHPPLPLKARTTNLSSTFPLHWSVRQRRSRPSLKSTPTSSPTTPLSWSGGATSVSGGFEESSQPPSNRPDAPRSKVNAAYGISTSKRTKKRKNIVELKEEETLLLKERKDLKRELATLRSKLVEQKAANERLKRLKVESESKSAEIVLAPPSSIEVIAEKLKQEHVPNDLLIPSATQADVKTEIHKVGTSESQNVPASDEDDKFVLPDLNLSIDDSNSGTLDRIS